MVCRQKKTSCAPPTDGSTTPCVSHECADPRRLRARLSAHPPPRFDELLVASASERCSCERPPRWRDWDDPPVQVGGAEPACVVLAGGLELAMSEPLADELERKAGRERERRVVRRLQINGLPEPLLGHRGRFGPLRFAAAYFSLRAHCAF